MATSPWGMCAELGVQAWCEGGWGDVRVMAMMMTMMLTILLLMMVMLVMLPMMMIMITETRITLPIQQRYTLMRVRVK